jgi:hypothetical protein
LQQVRIQQTHELKKKEKEFIKLQERLIQVLQEKKKESKTGMEIMNLLQACTCFLCFIYPCASAARTREPHYGCNHNVLGLR